MSPEALSFFTIDRGTASTAVAAVATVSATHAAASVTAPAPSAGNDVDLAADLVISSNGGGSWAPLTAIGSKAFVAGGHWGSVSNLADADLDVGQNVRFGVAVNRGGAAGSTDLADSRCQLRVSIISRTGASSPF